MESSYVRCSLFVLDVAEKFMIGVEKRMDR